MRRSSIILRYTFTWLLATTGYFFISEKLTKWIAPGFDNAVIWLWVLSAGWFIIFSIMLTIFIMKLVKHKKSRQNNAGLQ